MADAFFAELNKIPPVTRTIVLGSIFVTLLPKLQLVSAYPFLLWWPAVTKRFQLWRLFTSFLLDPAPGIQPLFDLFMLYRSLNDLELNTYYRSTSKMAWALLITAGGIWATNYPLKSPLLFSPMLSALTYLWSRANPHSSVSFFGLISVPARWLPYAYLSLDLLIGGLGHAMHSATGLISAHVYYALDTILPSTRGGRGPRYLPGPPAWFVRLLPDSLDPATAGQRPATGEGGSARTTGWGGTAFAPRGRSFGDNAGATSVPASSRGNTLAGSSSSSSSSSSGGGGGWASWIPRFGLGGSGGGGGRTTVGSSGSRAGGGSSAPSREAMLAAAEARLRAQRERSIAGTNERAAAQARQAAAASSSRSPAAPSLAGRKEGAGTSALRGSDASGSEAIRRVAASSSSSSSSSNSAGAPRQLSFAQLQAREETLRGSGSGPGETASGSGGRVAEVRRGGGGGDDGRGEGGKEGEKRTEDKDGFEMTDDELWNGGRASGGSAAEDSTRHTWGQGGRRLGD